MSDIQKNNKRTKVDWAKDTNTEGQSSLSVLLIWLLNPENFSLYRGDAINPVTGEKRKASELTKGAACKKIETFLAKKGFGHRKADAIKHKIDRMLKDYEIAYRWLQQVGQEIRGRVFDENNVENNRQIQEKTIQDGLLKRFQYYYEFEPLCGSNLEGIATSPTPFVDEDNNIHDIMGEDGGTQEGEEEELVLRTEPVKRKRQSNNVLEHFKDVAEKRVAFYEEEVSLKEQKLQLKREKVELKRQKFEFKKQKFEYEKLTTKWQNEKEKARALWEMYQDLYKHNLIDQTKYQENISKIEETLKNL
ncbi:hypothetical protein G6F56_006363 [Rhizopus delemar]|nr:hypothetical protein G6F56_006363 [Rhizopus delemar]